MFQPSDTDRTEMEFHFSKKFDGYLLFQLVRVQDFRVLGVYKPKAKKMHPVDLRYSTGSRPGGEVDWEYIIKANETPSPSWHGKYGQ